MWGIPFLFSCQSSSTSNPSGMSSHHFHDEYLGRAIAHGGNVQACFADRHSYILGNRAKAGAVVGNWQIVVDGLGNANAGNGEIFFVAEL